MSAATLATKATKDSEGVELNSLICQHVGQHQPCTVGSLFALFGGANAGQSRDELQRKRRLFASRLYHLTNWGRLSNTAEKGKAGIYVTGTAPLACDMPTQPGQAKPSQSTTWAGVKAPPPSYDVMHAPVYRTAPSAPMRPGADAFLHCPSREGSRLTRHHGGYVAALASGHTTPTTP